MTIIDQFRTELQQLVEDHSQPGWDGHESAPVTQQAADQLLIFLEQLPDFELPEIAADSDGDVSFEWNHAGKQLMASINEAGIVYWALQPADDERGSFGSARPDVLASLLSDIYGSDPDSAVC